MGVPIPRNIKRATYRLAIQSNEDKSPSKHTDRLKTELKQETQQHTSWEIKLACTVRSSYTTTQDPTCVLSTLLDKRLPTPIPRGACGAGVDSHGLASCDSKGGLHSGFKPGSKRFLKQSC